MMWTTSWTTMYSKHALLDVAIAFTLRPIAQVLVAQLLTEQLDDASLGFPFGLADAHARPLLYKRQAELVDECSNDN